MPDSFGRMTSFEAPRKLQEFCFPKVKSSAPPEQISEPREQEEKVETTEERLAKLLFAQIHPGLQWNHSGTIDDTSWRTFEGKCLRDASQILGLLKGGGWVKLAEDQDVPENPYKLDQGLYRSGQFMGYRYAQVDMYRAGWRKIETEG